MAEQCPLSAPLIVKDLQSGVAGETGTVWSIARDCGFTVARQIGTKVLDAHKRGHLTSEQQARLKEMLDRSARLDFTKQQAVPSRANPRRISFSYGDRATVVTLPPGGGDVAANGATSGAANGATSGATGGDDQASTIFELTATIKAMLGN